MDVKDKVEQFKKLENNLKVELLKAIRAEFDKYGKDIVHFLYQGNKDDDNFEEDSDYCNELCMEAALPLISDKYCIIDTRCCISHIKLENDELHLYCTGESNYFPYKYLSLDEPEWGLSVSDLNGILKLLEMSFMKENNK